MMRRTRKAAVAPLLALLSFEVAAIVALHSIGSVQSMQVPWGEDLSTWLSTGTVDQIAAPLIRMFTLVVAYWMLGSTLLSVIAQLTRVQGAIKATSMFTLPSVRRAVEGAMAVSIATSSFVGMTGTALADTASNYTSSISLADDSMSVPTPRPSGIPASENDVLPPNFSTNANVATEVIVDASPVASVSSNQYQVAASSAADAGSGDTSIAAPATGNDSVPTPRVGILADEALPQETTTSTSTTSTTSTTTTLLPRQEPATQTQAQAPTPTPAAPQTPAPKTEVLGVQEYQVKAGDNLWSISRDALATATNRSAADLSNQEIWEYWTEVKAANQDNLRSGDPHWIFPDEVIKLPAHTTTAK